VTGPTFFIIGAARCGTTAIATALGDRPDVFITKPKEPHFLAFEGETLGFTGPGDELGMNRDAVTDPDAYLELYRGSDAAAARGDASVSTLYYPERSIEVIQRRFPDAHLVVALRDPVERAYSAFQYLRARGVEPLDDFGAALEAEPERIAAGWHHLWHYEGMGHYATQLAPFVETFGRDRLHVVDHDDLAADLAGTVGAIDRFLGLSPRQRPPSTTPVNVSGEHRLWLTAALNSAIESRPWLKDAIRRAVPFRMRELVRRSVLVRGSMDGTVQQHLGERYRDDLAALPAIVGRTLSFT
jgi:hypothetical protein